METEEKEGESRTLLRFASATEEDGSDGRREGCLTGRRRYFLSFLPSKACKLQCIFLLFVFNDPSFYHTYTWDDRIANPVMRA